MRVPETQSGTAGIVIDAWKHLRVHSESCRECEVAVAQLRGVIDVPAAVWPLLCDEGRRLFTAWDAAKRELPPDAGPADRALASIRQIRALFEFEGLGEAAADQRNRALERVPPEAFQRLKELPLEERMAEVRALERAALRESAVGAERAESAEGTVPRERLCEGPGCAVFFTPAFPRQRFHNETCRKRANR